MINVVELNRLSDLEPLRPMWHKLLAQTTGYSFFQTPEWLATSWDHYPERQRLRVLRGRVTKHPWSYFEHQARAFDAARMAAGA